jgi:hypothetical protein
VASVANLGTSVRYKKVIAQVEKFSARNPKNLNGCRNDAIIVSHRFFLTPCVVLW